VKIADSPGGVAVKFLVLCHADESKWVGVQTAEFHNHIEDCFRYDLELRKNGHWVHYSALTPVKDAATIQTEDGRPIVTDGPYTESKEQIGGVLVLEARDKAHAVELMAKHPGVATGRFVIRPVNEQFEGIFSKWVEANGR
jgi:hypothetical protein